MSARTAQPATGQRAIVTCRDAAPGLSLLTGVLLPPVDPAGPPRLHTDDDVVVEVLPGWVVEPVEPDQARCPARHPLYHRGEIPAQLATEAGLKQQRRRVADGQKPIASYQETLGRVGRALLPLYAVADAAEMMPLSQGRLDQIGRARTCARCGARRDRPYKVGLDGSRYCPPCAVPAAEAWWEQQQAADRASAAAWAAGVLADPAVLLVVSTRTWPALLHAEMPHGGVVVSLALGNSAGGALAPWRVDGQQLRVVDAVDAVPAVRALAGRRLIVWEMALARINRIFSDVHGGGIRLTVRDSDRYGPHVDRWRAVRPPGHGTTLRRVWRYQSQPPPRDPFDVISAMRSGLREMADHALTCGGIGDNRSPL